MSTKFPERLAASGARGRREQNKAATRGLLLSSARALFGEKGLQDTSIDEVTVRSGVAKGTFYLYFHGKEDLVAAVAGLGFDELNAQVERRCRGAGSLEPVLTGLAEAHYLYMLRHPGMRRLFHQASDPLVLDRPGWRPVKHLVDAHVRGVAARLGAVASPLVSSPAARSRLARLLFGVAAGASAARASSGAPGPLARDVASFVRAFTAMGAAYASKTGRKNRHGGSRAPGREARA